LLRHPFHAYSVFNIEVHELKETESMMAYRSTKVVGPATMAAIFSAVAPIIRPEMPLRNT
jgi:hypothetical protein